MSVRIFLPPIHSTYQCFLCFPKYIILLSLSCLKQKASHCLPHKVQLPVPSFQEFPLTGPSLLSQETCYSSYLLSLGLDMVMPITDSLSFFLTGITFLQHTLTQIIPIFQLYYKLLKEFRTGILSYVFSIAVKEENMVGTP